MPKPLKSKSLLDEDFFKDEEDFEEDYSGEDSPADQSIGLELGFNPDMPEEEKVELAKKYINIFFSGREYHSGGKLSRYELETPYYISLVLNTEISNGFELAYDMMGGENLDYQFEEEDTTITKDMSKVLTLLTECANLRIPKMFASGIIVMYLEVCEGFEPPQSISTKFSLE